jgi:hypothetical protein
MDKTLGVSVPTAAGDCRSAEIDCRSAEKPWFPPFSASRVKLQDNH